MKFLLRYYDPSDASQILNVHYHAVHISSMKDYSFDILIEWSPPVTESRIKEFLQQENDFTRIVAEYNNQIIGFGEIVLAKSELRACYVHPDFSRRGVGSKIIKEIELIALENGISELFLNSSITAEKFYLAQGYEVIEYGEHTLRTGRKMSCVKMVKDLNSKQISNTKR